MLAERLRQSAELVEEPQRARIMERLARDIFVSHTSADDQRISTHILPILGLIFPDPFFHSIRTGAPDSYLKIVGLSLLSCPRIISIWSKNIVSSEYFLAEQQLAMTEGKSIIVFGFDEGLSLHKKMTNKFWSAYKTSIIDAGANLQLGLQGLRSIIVEWAK